MHHREALAPPLPAHTHLPGPAPALLFIHGWSCRRDDWQAQLDHFEGTHELLAFDLPGHGDTPPVWGRRHSMAAFAADAAHALDRLTSPEAVLVGHSMGGAVALELARRLPARIAGVVLADTFLIHYGALSPEDIDGHYQPFAADFRTAMDQLVAGTLGPMADDALKSRLKAQMGAADPAWALPAWKALLAWNPMPVLAEIRAPIHAINCPLIGEAARRQLAPYMRTTVLPDTGHFLQMEAPQRFNAALAAVLREWAR